MTYNVFGGTLSLTQSIIRTVRIPGPSITLELISSMLTSSNVQFAVARSVNPDTFRSSGFMW